MKRRRRRHLTEKQRKQARHDGHRRYYAKTAWLYKARPWTDEEDEKVLSHAIPDSVLSLQIKRSLKSISNRRWRLKKQSEITAPATAILDR